MTGTPIADQALAAVPPQYLPERTVPGAQLAIPTPAEVAEILGVRRIDMRAWIMALAEQEQFEETDTEEAGLSILRSIFTAQSSEQVFAAMDMKSAEDLIGKEPGAGSQVLEFTTAFPLSSTFEEGPSCFAVFSCADITTHEPVSFSCGARAVQGAMIMHMINGWTPFKARVVRRRKPTRAGFYPLNLERGI